MGKPNLTGNWNYPTQVRAGAGRSDELADCCRELDISSPLLITDPGISSLPMLADTLEKCQTAGLKVSLFDGVKSNPTGSNVMAGLEAFRAGQHDGVIAFGGGSALDAAKAVALMAGQEGRLWDYEDVGDNWTRINGAGIAPIIALPTTAGTGSEVGRASVILDEEARLKRIIFHPRMLPSIVLLDPLLTVGLPPHLTAATGMDALSHNLEALCAVGWHPMADGIALEGIRLVKEYLPQAVRNGSDVEARGQMIVASSMGATAFQKGLGAMHALAHPLGALYDAHHGQLNAIVMPYVLVANRPVIEPVILRASRYLGLQNGFNGFLDWILELRHEVGIQADLGKIGIDSSCREKVGRMATEDPTAGGNPIAFSSREYSELFCKAVHGEL